MSYRFYGHNSYIMHYTNVIHIISLRLIMFQLTLKPCKSVKTYIRTQVAFVKLQLVNQPHNLPPQWLFTALAEPRVKHLF
jgi:hypothetical protein